MAGQIQPVDEVSLEGFVVERISASLVFCPKSQFLGTPAVIGLGPFPEGKPEFGGGLTEMSYQLRYFRRTFPEQLLQP